MFLYSAFEWVTTSAEEVRKPASINRGMLIAIGILCVVCAVATVAMSHTLTHHELTSAYPQLYLGVAALGHSGLWVMAGVTAVTALNTFNGGFITASRFIYGTAREGLAAPPAGPAQRPCRALGPRRRPRSALGRVALVVALTHGWQVLVAVGAALEGMIYAVAGSAPCACGRASPICRALSACAGSRSSARLASALFGVLAVLASVSVQDTFNPSARDHPRRRRPQRVLRPAGAPGRPGARSGAPGSGPPPPGAVTGARTRLRVADWLAVTVRTMSGSPGSPISRHLARPRHRDRPRLPG